MKDDSTIEKVIDRLENTVSGRLLRDQRIRIGTFIGEVNLWSGRTHLVGKAKKWSNMEDLVRDSWALWNFAREKGVLTSLKGKKGKGRVVKVADIGAGAGFPGIVWKIADPLIDITLFERKERPAVFLERIISLLGIGGVRVVGGDARVRGKHGSFDVVVSKAAGKLPLLLPLAEMLLRKGGAYLTVKGKGWEEEADGARPGGLDLRDERRIEGGRGVMLFFMKR